jgi:hypothetical protein
MRLTPVTLSPLGFSVALLLGASPVFSQSGSFDLSWYSIDGGGSTAGSTSGNYIVAGTAGQPDAGVLAGGTFVLISGFWGATGSSSTPTCYANCDQSTQPPILNVADFSCFLTKFAAGDPYANCDGSTQEPVLNVADFSCFLGKFAAGCR